jgi:hypothetical protein
MDSRTLLMLPQALLVLSSLISACVCTYCHHLTHRMLQAVALLGEAPLIVLAAAVEHGPYMQMQAIRITMVVSLRTKLDTILVSNAVMPLLLFSVPHQLVVRAYVKLCLM